MIRHIVLWKLKAEDAEGKARDAAAIAAALEPLVDVIDELISLKVSPNMAYLETNWDVVLVAEYNSVADLAAYQVHPAHVEAAAVPRALGAQRVAVDIEI